MLPLKPQASTPFIKVAAIQFRPNKGRWDDSATALAALIDQAAGQGAKLIVCPEMALTGYLFPDPHSAALVAEPQDGPTFTRFSALARQHACHLVIGYPENSGSSGSRLYNSALIIGPDGSLRYNYRKRLLYHCDETWALPGDTPYPLLRHDDLPGDLTAGICMDLNDDRFTAFLRRQKPALIAFCTNWIHEGHDIRPYWSYRLRGVRASFIAANTYSREILAQPPYMSAHFLGFSAVLGPDGETLAMAEETGDQVVLAQVPCNSKADPRK